MITEIFFTLIILINSGAAQAFEVKRLNDRLYLSDQSCDVVESATLSLSNWTDSTKEKNRCSIDTKKPKINIQGFCELDITNCVPNHVRKYEGLRSKTGPNCYNLALVFKGILPALRYSDPEEISFYMKPPICKPVDLKNVSPGDIGLMATTQSNQPDHAFIVISDKLVYNKPNSSVYDPYQISTHSQMLKQQKNSLSTAYGSANLKTKYYRCQTMQSYLKETSHVPDEIISSLNKIQSFEKCYEGKSVNGDTLSSEAKRSLIDTTKALAVYLKKGTITNQKPKNEKTEFLLAALQLRLQSIANGLSAQSFWQRDSEARELNAQLEPLAKEINASLVDLGIVKPPQQ